MGFFSWKCAVSGESIASIYAGLPREKSQCYLVTPTKSYYEPAYDGYGHFDGNDVYELLGDGDREEAIKDRFQEGRTAKFDIKVVLKEYYNNQTYEELPKSDDCEFQGFFY